MRLRATAVAMVMAAMLTAALPTTVYAQAAEEKANVDARLEGYERKVAVGTNGTSPTWMAFVGLIIVGCAGLFKNAKREPSA